MSVHRRYLSFKLHKLYLRGNNLRFLQFPTLKWGMRNPIYIFSNSEDEPLQSYSQIWPNFGLTTTSLTTPQSQIFAVSNPTKMRNEESNIHFFRFRRAIAKYGPNLAKFWTKQYQGHLQNIFKRPSGGEAVNGKYSFENTLPAKIQNTWPVSYLSHTIQTWGKGGVIGAHGQRLLTKDQLPRLDIPGRHHVSGGRKKESEKMSWN